MLYQLKSNKMNGKEEYCDIFSEVTEKNNLFLL